MTLNAEHEFRIDQFRLEQILAHYSTETVRSLEALEGVDAIDTRFEVCPKKFLKLKTSVRKIRQSNLLGQILLPDTQTQR